METEITEQQIRKRANEIGHRSAFPVHPDASKSYVGMTYYQYLIGQTFCSPAQFDAISIVHIIDVILTRLAKAELEAEHEVSND